MHLLLCLIYYVKMIKQKYDHWIAIVHIPPFQQKAHIKCMQVIFTSYGSLHYTAMCVGRSLNVHIPRQNLSMHRNTITYAGWSGRQTIYFHPQSHLVPAL